MHDTQFSTFIPGTVLENTNETQILITIIWDTTINDFDNLNFSLLATSQNGLLECQNLCQGQQCNLQQLTNTYECRVCNNQYDFGEYCEKSSSKQIKFEQKNTITISNQQYNYNWEYLYLDFSGKDINWNDGYFLRINNSDLFNSVILDNISIGLYYYNADEGKEPNFEENFQQITLSKETIIQLNSQKLQTSRVIVGIYNKFNEFHNVQSYSFYIEFYAGNTEYVNGQDKKNTIPEEDENVIDQNILIIIILIITVVIIFLVALCLMKECRKSNQVGIIGIGGLNDMSIQQIKKDFDEQRVKAIMQKYMPTIVMNPLIKKTKLETDGDCQICLEEIKVQQKIRILVCDHIFHEKCVDDWVLKNANCPLCRQSFESEKKIKKFLEEKRLKKMQSDLNNNSARETDLRSQMFSEEDMNKNNIVFEPKKSKFRLGQNNQNMSVSYQPNSAYNQQSTEVQTYRETSTNMLNSVNMSRGFMKGSNTDRRSSRRNNKNKLSKIVNRATFDISNNGIQNQNVENFKKNNNFMEDTESGIDLTQNVTQNITQNITQNSKNNLINSEQVQENEGDTENLDMPLSTQASQRNNNQNTFRSSSSKNININQYGQQQQQQSQGGYLFQNSNNLSLGQQQGGYLMQNSNGNNIQNNNQNINLGQHRFLSRRSFISNQYGLQDNVDIQEEEEEKQSELG